MEKVKEGRGTRKEGLVSSNSGPGTLLDLLSKKSTYLFLAATIFVVILPHYSSPYALRLMITMGSGIIAAMCLNVVLGYMGYPSLCQNVFFGVGAYTMALATLRLGVSPWTALILSPLTTFIIGYLAAIPLLKLRSMFFAIGTLALTGVVSAILVNLPKITGADAGLRGIPRLVKGDINFFYLEIALMLIILLLTVLMSRSYWGKILMAIREDEDLAPHLGINTTRYKRLTFAATSALTGVAGAIFFSYQTYISSNYFTIGSSFTALAVAVVGGGGTALGPIFGGLVVVGAPEVFRSMNLWRPSFVGAVLVIVILLSPGGIVGISQNVRGYLRKRGEK
jgi:branched-chain amino acid transport system permease protein